MPAVHYYNVKVESTVRVRAECPEQAASVASSAAKFGQTSNNSANGNRYSGQADTVSRLEVINITVEKEF